MPVASRSRASSSAMSCLPFVMSLFTSSSSALKPSRIMPPSRIVCGGSSTTARSMSSQISESTSMRLSMSRSIVALNVAESAFSCGKRVSADHSARRSLPFTEPYTTRVIMRSRSKMPVSASVTSSKSGRFSNNSSTAFCRQRNARRAQKRLLEPCADKPLAHRRFGLVKHPQKRAAGAPCCASSRVIQGFGACLNQAASSSPANICEFPPCAPNP